MAKKIKFEYQEFKGYTLVALDARLEDFKPQPVKEGGKLKLRVASRTIKDCTKIDGCIYMHLGRVTDEEMIQLIELFQKLKKENNNWKQERGLIVPNVKLEIE